MHSFYSIVIYLEFGILFTHAEISFVVRACHSRSTTVVLAMHSWLEPEERSFSGPQARSEWD